MNSQAVLKGVPVRYEGCGREAMQNVERAFWQSRMTSPGFRAEPIVLTDLHKLARQIRSNRT